MPKVYTIFCCGTGSNQEDRGRGDIYWNGELISTLAFNHAGEHIYDWVILDGPGSGGLQTDQLWAESFHSSFLEGKRGTLFGTGWEENAAAAVAYVKGKAAHHGSSQIDKKKQAIIVDSFLRQSEEVVSGMTAGKRSLKLTKAARATSRMNQAVSSRPRITPQMLQEEIMRRKRNPEVSGPSKQGSVRPRTNDPITTVNLIGWSRGAVTCIMIANRLHKECPQVKVNIFAADPVPGYGQFKNGRCEINSNVQNFTGVYARHEMSFGFIPIIPQKLANRVGQTNREIYSIWGRHGTLVGNAARDGSTDDSVACKEPGQLIRDMAERLLESWGTPLNDKLALTPIDALKKYDKMLTDSRIYKDMRKTVYIGKKDKLTRHVGINKNDTLLFDEIEPLQAHGPFVNCLHMQLAIKQKAAIDQLGQNSNTRKAILKYEAGLP